MKSDEVLRVGWEVWGEKQSRAKASDTEIEMDLRFCVWAMSECVCEVGKTLSINFASKLGENFCVPVVIVMGYLSCFMFLSTVEGS